MGFAALTLYTNSRFTYLLTYQNPGNAPGPRSGANNDPQTS